MPALLLSAIMLAAAPAAPPAEDFAGLYINGFETSDFVSCGGATKGGRFWRAGYGAAEARIIEDWRAAGRRGAEAFPFLWIEFSGRLSPRGEYGHLGLYPREVSVVSLKTVRVATDAHHARCAAKRDAG